MRGGGYSGAFRRFAKIPWTFLHGNKLTIKMMEFTGLETTTDHGSGIGAGDQEVRGKKEGEETTRH